MTRPPGRSLLILTLALSACGRGQPSDRIDDNAIIANIALNAATGSPDHRCASSATYTLIKRELFHRASELRGNNDDTFQQVAGLAALRVERPVVESDDEGQGAISCSASISLDLPPGIAASGSRTSLSADLDYVLQPKADGSGDSVTLPRPDAIIVPLSTVARSAPEPVVPEPDNEATPAPPVAIHRTTQPPDPLAPAQDPLAPNG